MGEYTAPIDSPFPSHHTRYSLIKDLFLRRRIFSPTFSSPFAEPEPEPEPSSRARFGGSFSRRFFDARVAAPVKPRPPVPPSPPSPPSLPSPPPPPAIAESVEVKPAETLQESEPVIEQRSLALPLQDFPVNNIIFADPPPPPPPPPPPSSIWNVDTEIFQIVPAVPGREIRVTEDLESQSQPKFIALLAVPDHSETDRSRLDSSGDVGNEISNEEYLDIINCDFDCVTKLCQSDDEQCIDSCYQYCSRNPE